MLNSKIKSGLTILFLVLLTLFFRSHKINSLYNFEWDQERDAYIVSGMIKDHKPVLIGPRVINDSGFFVGPFHYYFLLPFYLLNNNNPFAGAQAAVFVEVITVIVLYILVLKIFNKRVAFWTSFIFSLTPLVVCWNVMHIPLFSIFIFYLCYLLMKNDFRIFPILIFVFVLASTNHPSMLTLFIPIITAYILSSSKLSTKTICLSLLMAIIPLLPLIFFDLRHDFINIKSIINFLITPKTINTTNPWLFLRSYWRALNVLTIQNDILLLVEKSLILAFGITGFILIKDKKLKWLILIWILTPIVILSTYKGDIPEYYYSSSLILMPILIGIFLTKFINKKFIPIVVILAIVFQYLNFPNNFGAPSLKYKIEAVSYIANQKVDKEFNVSYDLPLGMNNGYKYLFSYLKKEPIDIPEAHLYSIYLIDKTPLSGKTVYQNQMLGVIRR